MKNTAKQYRKQTYSSLPKWLLNVYDADHPFAENGGAIQTFDMSRPTTNSARFRNREMLYYINLLDLHQSFNSHTIT
jgi:hypothetical protein